MNKLRLGFHYHVPAMLDNGNIYMPGYLGRFIDGLAIHCSRLVCFLHSPRPEEKHQMDFSLSATNVELVDIGPHASVFIRTAFASRFSHHLRSHIKDIDALLVRGPSPLLADMAAVVHPMPVVLLIVGDYLSGVEGLPQPRWRKEMIRMWSWWNTKRQLKVASRSLTFVNSRVLYQQFKPYVPNLVETRTTTLTADDYYWRGDVWHSPPYHILYVGRISQTKGILDILEAVSLLIKSGQDIVFDLVGPQEKGDPVLDKLNAMAHSHGISEKVIYHGYRPMGPELFEFYKRSDVYVIASHAEGFPRTIWEAMSHSLPVVATRVGSIPDYLTHGRDALLVSPKDPLALSEALLKLIKDVDLRMRLVRNGYALAIENAVEKRSSEMVQEIQHWLAGRV
jgi:glycosyltransferase involved in cell wall biosynthesis